jgi:hypothetical protein
MTILLHHLVCLRRGVLEEEEKLQLRTLPSLRVVSALEKNEENLKKFRQKRIKNF